MNKFAFAKRLYQLRLAKGVSVRDISLSLGQSAGYINNIENEVRLSYMQIFFYFCEYLGVTQTNILKMNLKPNKYYITN